jgi:hypothetical protein
MPGPWTWVERNGGWRESPLRPDTYVEALDALVSGRLVVQRRAQERSGSSESRA